MKPILEPSPESHAYDFLAGGGEMGARIRAKDWAATPLGPVEQWPQSLKTIVRIMLTSRQPIWIGWGPQLIKLYNDPYKAIVGGKHPDALGQPAAVVWREIWTDIDPMLTHVMTQNEGTYVESQLLIMERYGYAEETYYTFSYNPVPADPGGVGGMICTNTDDTQRVIGERQVALLRTLAAETADARSAADVCRRAAASLGHNTHDLPFALLYLLDPEQRTVHLAGTSGISAAHAAAPARVSLDQDSPWPVARVLETGKPVILSDLGAAGPDLPTGAWRVPPQQAIALPLPQAGETGQAGVLVVGLNPFRRLDDGYHGFLDLVAGQIAASIAHAQAYEDERKRAEALAELDRAKTTFFSNVSHEFRTPLTLMLGPVEDALNDPDTNAVNQERMAVAHRNALRLLKLVNALLDFSRIEAGRVQVRYEPTDLAAYTTDLASSFRAAVESAGLALIVDCPPLAAPVYIDRDMWEKIVLNLLSNAFKFTLRGRITVTLRQHGNAAELVVADSGVGIPEGELAHIFERFHRVQGAEGRTYEGTGLGLALVQELVKLHGGAITVASMYHQGSSFRVTIPLGTAHLPAERIAEARPGTATARSAQAYVGEARRWLPQRHDTLEIIPDVALPAEPEAPAPPPRVAPLPQILLADDNADMRDYISRLLADQYAVTAVTDGAVALVVARRDRPDLILTDIMMPNMNGVDLLRALRADPVTQTIPIIMLSARAGEEARIEGVTAGADDYLVKPFSARELRARVAAHLAMARLRQDAARAVQSERRHLYETFMQAPASIAVLIGPRHVFDLANPSFMQLVGPRRDILGKPVQEALPEVVDQGFITLLDQVYDTGRAFAGNEMTARLDRTGTGRLDAVDLNFVYQPYLDPHGNIQGILIYAVDITEQLRARRREAVNEARQAFFAQAGTRLAASLDYPQAIQTVTTLPIPVFADMVILDLLTPEGAVERVSVAAADPATEAVLRELQARYPADPGGQAALAVIAAGRPRLVEAWTEAQMQAETQDAAHLALVRQLGIRAFVVVPLPARGRTLGALTLMTGSSGRSYTAADLPIVEDLAGRVALALDNARLYAEAQAAIGLRDQFLTLASHELKTPLTAVLAGLQMIVRRQARTATWGEADARTWSLVQAQAHRLGQLIDMLLDVSRLQRGHLELDRVPLDLAGFAQRLVQEVGPTLPAHPLTYQGPPEGIWIAGDPMRLEQVVQNLLSNAAKYSPGGGPITVQVRPQAGQAILAVHDAGIGIPAEALPHLFTQFYRAANSREAGISGLGIGLYLVRQIVELHGGQVLVQSHEGQGSTFSVQLPLIPPPAPA
jgi:signal transduction histidine kinase/CheY-like chemotaxis protein